MVDSPKERMAEIIKAIYRKTIDKEIRWERITDAKDSALSTSIGNNTVNLAYYNYKRGGAPQRDLKLVIYDARGNETDSIRDTQLDDDSLPINQISWWAMMSELYNAASRQTLGSDEVLDEISKSLGL